ncbi:unnamed protein product [Amoebophrya sp. A25]|nr:unnamed protein product [Amoebophrya sp. A25]|eukprot:GSA25T00024795001.1
MATCEGEPGGPVVPTYAEQWKRFSNNASDDSSQGKDDSKNDSEVDPSTSTYIAKHASEFHKFRPDYLPLFISTLGNQYHPDKNPTGKANLCVAENKRMAQPIAERLARCTALTDFPHEMLHYHDFSGTEATRRIFAHVLEKHVFFGGSTATASTSDEAGTTRIDPSQLCLVNGCTSLLVTMTRILCEPESGDAIMFAEPRYPGFSMDAAGLARAKVVGVPLVFERRKGVGNDAGDPSTALHVSCSLPSDETLNKHLAQSQKDGLKVRAFLLSSPDNPTGTVWTQAELLRLVQWCRRNQILILSDEIYASSVFDQQATVVLRRHFSLAKYADATFWGLSKDFASSGARMAVLYCENKKLLSAFQEVNIVNSISGVAEQVFQELLADDAWLSAHLASARHTLQSTAKRVTDALTEMRIPFVPPGAAVFVWADFAEFGIPAGELFRVLLEDYCVMLTPGNEFWSDKSEDSEAASTSWMRLCYSASDDATLTYALNQLRQFVEDMRGRGKG